MSLPDFWLPSTESLDIRYPSSHHQLVGSLSPFSPAHFIETVWGIYLPLHTHVSAPSEAYLAPSLVKAEIRIADYAGNPTWGSEPARDQIDQRGENARNICQVFFFRRGDSQSIYMFMLRKGKF